MKWLIGLVINYWWVVLLAIGAIIAIIIFGGGGTDSDPSDPCALTGASGCM